MGTEVQTKMYLPGYYSAKGISGSAGYGGWSLHRESNSLKNGQHYGIFLSKRMIDGSDFGVDDKERLRQTIMEHDSIFRDQVHELHRLYKIQRDLMNEIKSKEQVRLLPPTGTSQSSLFSSSFPSEDDIKSWYVSKLPLVSASYGRPSTSGNVAVQSPQSSLKGKTTICSSGLTQNGTGLKDYETLDFKRNKLQRRLFDLELPANEYIDDGTEMRGEFAVSRTASLFNKSIEITQVRDKHLSNNTGNSFGHNGNVLRTDLFSRKNHKVTDLNEPIESEEFSEFASPNWICFKDRLKGQALSYNGGISNVLVKNEKNEKDCSSYALEAGKVRSNNSCGGSFHLEGSQKACEPLRIEASKASESVSFLPSDQNMTGKQTERKIFGIQIPERNDFKGLNSQTKLVSQSEMDKLESSCISSWTRPQNSLNQNLISAQGTPGFNAAAQSNKGLVFLMQSPQVTASAPSFKPEVSYTSDAGHSELKTLQARHPSFSHGFPNGKGCSSASKQLAQHGSQGYLWGLGCSNSKNEVAPPNAYQCEVIGKQNVVSVDEPSKAEKPQGGLSWLMSHGKSLKEESEGSHQMKIDSIGNYSQLFVNQIDSREGPLQSPVKDHSSTIPGNSAKHGRVEATECLSIKRILGVPIFDFPSRPGSAVSVTGNGNPTKIGSIKSDLPCELIRSEEQLKVEGPIVGKGLDNNNTDVKSQIDLNICILEEEDQLTPASPIAKPSTGIDLEAPGDFETEMDIRSGEESSESKLLEPLVTLGSECGLPIKKLDEAAAEALVALSSFAQKLQDNDVLDCENGTEHQSYSLASDSLHWFADIISSLKVDIETEAGRGESIGIIDEEFSVDGLDYFECMTLNLAETKVEESGYEAAILDEPKEEETVQRRPRRGQARRGRQRKDFQRDILPGLVCLSRNEVTKDVQTIEALVRATGGTWQSSLAQRNAKSGGGRGRKRLGCSAPSPPVAAVCQPQIQQSNCKELGLEERSLTGWGKRTRRPPRQRCPITNFLVPLK